MGAKILLVDDDRLVRQIVKNYLSEEGFEIRTAENGKDALQLAEIWEPDLVLLDVMMPGMTGFEVCRRMRQMPATTSIPIIMVSAQSDIKDKTAGFEAGADNYVTKPFVGTELKLHIQAQLKRTQMSQSDRSRTQGQVIAFFSLRGGSGVTSLAINTAIALSEIWDYDIPLLDISLPTGSTDIALNLRPKYDLGKLTKIPIEDIDNDLIDGYLGEGPARVRLLRGITQPEEADLVRPNLIAYLMEKIRIRYQYIVLDLSHDFSPVTLAALDAADRIVVLLPPEVSALRLAHIAFDTFSLLGYEQRLIHLLVNWTFPRHGIAVDEIEKNLKHQVDTVLPYAPDLFVQALNTGIPVTIHSPDSPLTAMLEDLAWQLSKPAHQHKHPNNATPTWERVVARIRQSPA